MRALHLLLVAAEELADRISKIPIGLRHLARVAPSPDVVAQAVNDNST